MTYKRTGEHKYFLNCRFCFSANVEAVINLGFMPLAGRFFKKGTTKEELEKEKFYPLILHFCKDCYLLQVNSSIEPNILFKNYFYFSSSIKTLVDHFENIASDLTKVFNDPSKRFIAEIGCNDGSFIKSLTNKGFRSLGVDPATNVVKPAIKNGIPIINAYFTEKLAKEIAKKYDLADAIFGFHSLAHIEDMHDVIKGVKALLKKDGFLALEVHYLGDLVREVQYDMIYHEHQFYYSLLALKNFFTMHDMEIFNVKPVPIRGGSMMFFVQNKSDGKRKISLNVNKLLGKERQLALDKIATFKKFSKYIQKTRNDLLKLITKLKSKRKTIAGYGASGRGTILLNYCNLTEDLLNYVVDDAPVKHGAFTPGTHHKIYSSDVLNTDNRPDYMILFAWPFIEEIKKKHTRYLEKGGKFIVPLPKVRIIN